MNGRAPTSRGLLRPGEQLGRYEVVSEIAHGGMATVYVARLTSIGGFGRLVAMKVLLPHLRSDHDFVNMLLDEARIAALIHHPNVIQIVDIDRHEGTPYVVMELLRGHTLSGLMRRAAEVGRQLPMGALLSMLAGVADGLHAAHEATDDDGEPLGVVHRDVSPQNIHLGYDGVVKVVDFGIAKAQNRLSETQNGEVKGKLGYLAPEQLDATISIDRRVDVWALGIVAYEVLSGGRLFRSEDASTTLWNVLNKEVEPLSRVAPNVPSEVSSLLVGALQRERERRPSSCGEMAQVFQDAARSLGGGPRKQLATLMEELFGPDRAAEEAQIAAEIRRGPAPSSEEADRPDEVRTRSTRRRPAARRRRRIVGPLVVVSAVAAAVIAGVVWVPFDGSNQASPEPAPVPVEASPPRQSAEAPAGSEAVEESPARAADPVSVPRTVTFDVDERAQLVLVDGVRHDERPLELELSPDAVARVELIGRDGTRAVHDVRADDGGPALRLPEPRAGARQRRRPGMRSAPSMEPRSTAEERARPSRKILGWSDVFGDDDGTGGPR